MYISRFKRLASLKFFDVTLRDGLQSIPKIYSIATKTKMLHNIIKTHSPSAIEVGSIVSPKVLPQMADSLLVFKEAQLANIILPKPIDIYMLTPTLKSVKIACDNHVNNFSFITSVSNEFQKKNINKTLDETKNELENMIQHVSVIPDTNVKLYISCISECPVAGTMENYRIISEILCYYYSYENLDEICLSDTCGTLSFYDFRFIMEQLIGRNLNMKKFSLHLHNQPNNLMNLRNIIIYAMKCGIYRFDVSNMPDIGGCSVTMDKTKTNGNLSYEQVIDCV
jgi:hydroxymethylglutaryl-CoA lyase